MTEQTPLNSSTQYRVCCVLESMTTIHLDYFNIISAIKRISSSCQPIEDRIKIHSRFAAVHENLLYIGWKGATTPSCVEIGMGFTFFHRAENSFLVLFSLMIASIKLAVLKIFDNSWLELSKSLDSLRQLHQKMNLPDLDFANSRKFNLVIDLEGKKVDFSQRSNP